MKKYEASRRLKEYLRKNLDSKGDPVPKTEDVVLPEIFKKGEENDGKICKV